MESVRRDREEERRRAVLKEFHKRKLEELKDEVKPPVHSASGKHKREEGMISLLDSLFRLKGLLKVSKLSLLSL